MQRLDPSEGFKDFARSGMRIVIATFIAFSAGARGRISRNGAVEEAEGAADELVEETIEEAAPAAPAAEGGGGGSEEAGVGEGEGDGGGERDEGGEALGDGEAAGEGPRVVDPVEDVEEEVVR